MSEPIPIRVTRYRCPHCARSHSARGRCVEHIGRCWQNPGAKGCKTCKHYAGWDWEGNVEVCEAGVDLSGRPACVACGGHSWAPTNYGGEVPCGPEVSANHVGNGSEVKPGPIVHCDKWEPADG